MSSRLNPQCKRLFLEFSAKKCRRKMNQASGSIQFFKYPLMSKSFLYYSKVDAVGYSRPVFVLAVLVCVPDSAQVCLGDASEDTTNRFSPWNYCTKLNLDSFQKMLLFLNPPTVDVDMKISESSNSNTVQEIFDVYEGKLRLRDSYSWSYSDRDCDEYFTPLINKWNQRISFLICSGAELLLHNEILPLNLDYYRLNHIKTDGVKEERVSPKHIGDLKHLKIRADFDELDSLVNLLHKNNFNLTDLLIETEIDEDEYPDYDSLLNNVLNVQRGILELKGKCINSTQKLLIKVEVDMFPTQMDEYDEEDEVEEWIEQLRSKCDLLKDAKHEIDEEAYDADSDGEEYCERQNHYLKTQIIDGYSTLDVTVGIHEPFETHYAW